MTSSLTVTITMPITYGTAYGYYTTRTTDGAYEFSGLFLAPLLFQDINPTQRIQLLIASACGLSGFGPFGEQGLIDDLDGYIAYGSPLLCRLFTNEFEPDCSTVLADFVEASWHLYAPQGPVVWMPAVTAAPALATKTSMPITFTSAP